MTSALNTVEWKHLQVTIALSCMQLEVVSDEQAYGERTEGLKAWIGSTCNHGKVKNKQWSVSKCVWNAVFGQTLHHRLTSRVTLTLLRPAALHFPRLQPIEKPWNYFPKRLQSHPSAVDFAAPSSWISGKRNKICVNSLLLFPASQRYPGDGSAPAEVVWPCVHRHGGWRGLLPGAALSVAKGWGDAAAGSSHAEVSQSDRPITALAEKCINHRGKLKPLITQLKKRWCKSFHLSASLFHFLHLTSESMRTLEFPPPRGSSWAGQMHTHALGNKTTPLTVFIAGRSDSCSFGVREKKPHMWRFEKSGKRDENSRSQVGNWGERRKKNSCSISATTLMSSKHVLCKPSLFWWITAVFYTVITMPFVNYSPMWPSFAQEDLTSPTPWPLLLFCDYLLSFPTESGLEMRQMTVMFALLLKLFFLFFCNKPFNLTQLHSWRSAHTADVSPPNCWSVASKTKGLEFLRKRKRIKENPLQ